MFMATTLGFVCMAIVAAGAASADDLVLRGDRQLSSNSNPSERRTDLFPGNPVSEADIGCLNASGTSGAEASKPLGETASRLLPPCFVSQGPEVTFA